MISKKTLKTCQKKLNFYDIDQGAWDHEPKGFAFNAHHVLTHLAKNLTAKDFNDVIIVKNEIAPDSTQYALRLARWQNLELDEIIQEPRRTIYNSEINQFASISTDFVVYAQAMSSLAKYLHQLDHAKSIAEEKSGQREEIKEVAQLLLHSADLQSQRYGFDIIDSLDTRLSELRALFSIPEPVN